MKFETIFNAQGDNLAEKLTEEELGKISASVHQGYKDDRTSRRGWEAQNAEGLKLALQLKESKSFPWENSANVKVPLVAMACVQYNARDGRLGAESRSNAHYAGFNGLSCQKDA